VIGSTDGLEERLTHRRVLLELQGLFSIELERRRDGTNESKLILEDEVRLEKLPRHPLLLDNYCR
jgi:hypothetical protein